jgi:hypothetical protein
MESFFGVYLDALKIVESKGYSATKPAEDDDKADGGSGGGLI